MKRKIESDNIFYIRCIKPLKILNNFCIYIIGKKNLYNDNNTI